MLAKILGVLIPSLVGIGVGFFLRWLWAQFQLKSAEKRVSQILEAAMREAETKKREMLLEAKDKLLEERRQLEKEFRERSVELQQNQRRLMQKEDLLDKRMETLDKKEQELEQERRLLKQKAEELQQAKNQILAGFYRQLKTIAGKANLLGTYEVFYGSWNQINEAPQKIEKVTAEDVRRVAAKIFSPRNRTVATLIPEQRAEAGQ